jgi:hypothetical protein
MALALSARKGWLREMKRVTREELIRLLLEARKLANQTVKDSNVVTSWHRRTDKALTGCSGDDPAERYDAPARIKHRILVDSLFSRRGL